jgi:succinoglycan biosynthesis protein ExoA
MAGAEGGVTVAVPVLNEESTLEQALRSLSRQTIGPEALEVLVYDGGSADRTAEIARSFAGAATWRRFEVLDNPAGTVPHALNAGLSASGSTWFTRLDGRSAFSDGYLEACIGAASTRQMAAAGGRLIAAADGRVANSIAAAVTHPLGVGRGFRTEREACELPHHPFAVWRTSDIRAIGGFDEELARNQDDEFSMRAVTRGATILLAPEASVTYRPRERFRGLAAQYFQYGLWKAAVGRRSGLFPLRSFAPAGVTVAAGAVTARAFRGSPLALAAGAAVYGALGWRIAGGRPDAAPLLTGAALATVHGCYGAGVLAGALRPGLTRSPLGTGRLR